MKKHSLWKTAWFALSLCIVALAIPSRAQVVAPDCDPANPSTCGIASPSTVPTNTPTMGSQNGAVSGGSISGGGQNTSPQGFSQVNGFPQAQTYNDNQNHANANDWWMQYRFNPERALRMAQMTEFQQMVQSSTGKILPIFGADLFWGSPSTFAPVEQIPVTPDYVLGPGDQLLVRIWGQVSLSAEVTVDREGNIFLPQVGTIQVSGEPFSQVQETIRSKIARIYRNFNVSVNMGQLRSIRIYVTGQARQPGSFTVSSLSTLVNALFVTGGPAPQGSFRHIQVRRNGQVITDFDLYALLIYGDKSKDVPLLPGDVIYIPPVGPQAAVFGSVRNSAIFELKSDTTVSEIIDDAGGLSVLASASNATIERIDARHQRKAINIHLSRQVKGEVLEDGDILRITPITPQFTQTVTIRGNVANPGRFGWHEGMKLSDVIPDTASLVTRNYWQRRNRFGTPDVDFEPEPQQQFQMQANNYSRAQTQSSPNQNYAQNGNNNQQTQNQANAATTYNNGAPVNGQDTYQQLASQVSGTGTSGNGSTPVNPNLPDCPASVLAPDSAPNGQSQSALVPGVTCNIRTTVLGGTTLADQQGRTYTENTAGADRINDVRLPAPDIDWSYAVIERLNPTTFKTTLIPFDPGKLLLQHDASQDLPLEAGDVITIFSQADIRVPLEQQTKLVRLEGEVVHAGVYSVESGETLRHLVERAGGLAPNAYLYGAEFTRVSTRIAQQARLDDYVSTLELEMDRAAVASSANALSAQDTASSQSTLQTTQLLISRLKLLRASGRIVLNLKPNASSIDQLPDLTLEDGDRLVVPAVPSSINVVGAVYDPSSFLFDRKQRVANYLHQAGGPNRDADRKHVFIVRADGAVISKDASKGFWGDTFGDASVNPGDTIVVPEKVYRGSAVRAFSNYSQIFSSLAFGAASLAIIQ